MNLQNKIKMINLEYLDNLPNRKSIRRCLVDKYGSIWNTRLDNHWRRRYKLHILAKRILNNNLGKNFNNAHRYFIKQSKKSVFKHDAYYVLDFELGISKYKRYGGDYFIDNDGNLQQYPIVKYFKLKNNITKHQYNKQKKLDSRRFKLTEEQFREILNAKKIKDKAQNDIIMIKKGFDPKTSFRYGI